MTTRRRMGIRMMVIGSAVAAALGVWVLAELIVGIDLRAPVPGGAGQTHDVTAITVVFPSLAAALAGWSLLAVLERLTSRARAIWTAVAVVVLLLSLGGPLSAAGIGGANKMWLAAMHVAVAGVLIPWLPRTHRPAATLSGA
jgi:hypothetical protein